jgi:hypothetical protein
MTVSRPSECLRICITLCALILTAGFTRAQIKPSLNCFTSTGAEGATLPASDKHSRVVELFDVTVHFKDPAINWEQVSDRFVKQFLVDDGTNPCITPGLLPSRFLGNPEPQTPEGQPEGTAGLDYLASGDLYKDPNGYRLEAYVETGKSHLVVLKRVQPLFTDPKDAPWQAQMAALNIRDVGTGSTQPLADLLLDFEKQQRQKSPRDHAIAPTLTLKLSEAERYPLTLYVSEKRKISFSLIDCDNVPLKGAEVKVETITGKVSPDVVSVDEQGSGQFTYTAPDHAAKGLIRVGFSYDRGSEHPGPPAWDTIDIRVGSARLSFRTTVDVKIRAEQINHNETHHSEAVYTPYPGSGTNCTTSMQPGERCQFAITTLHASATAQWPHGSHTASLSNAGNAVEAELIRGVKGATLRLAGPTFATMSPDEDDEHYIGVCIDQEWKPMQFDLGEEELAHFSTLHKTLSISSPLGVNNCVGSGTLVLTGQP